MARRCHAVATGRNAVNTKRYLCVCYDTLPLLVKPASLRLSYKLSSNSASLLFNIIRFNSSIKLRISFRMMPILWSAKANEHTFNGGLTALSSLINSSHCCRYWLNKMTVWTTSSRTIKCRPCQVTQVTSKSTCPHTLCSLKEIFVCIAWKMKTRRTC